MRLAVRYPTELDECEENPTWLDKGQRRKLTSARSFGGGQVAEDPLQQMEAARSLDRSTLREDRKIFIGGSSDGARSRTKDRRRRTLAKLTDVCRTRSTNESSLPESQLRRSQTAEFTNLYDDIGGYLMTHEFFESRERERAVLWKLFL